MILLQMSLISINKVYKTKIVKKLLIILRINFLILNTVGICILKPKTINYLFLKRLRNNKF